MGKIKENLNIVNTFLGIVIIVGGGLFFFTPRADFNEACADFKAFEIKHDAEIQGMREEAEVWRLLRDIRDLERWYKCSDRTDYAPSCNGIVPPREYNLYRQWLFRLRQLTGE